MIMYIYIIYVNRIYMVYFMHFMHLFYAWSWANGRRKHRSPKWQGVFGLKAVVLFGLMVVESDQVMVKEMPL